VAQALEPSRVRFSRFVALFDEGFDLMSFQTIQYELDEGIATLSLNRPEKLNAYNSVMMKELIAAFDKADGDDSVRAVIVTGTGRAFCSGVDLSGGAGALDFDKRPDKVELGSPIRADGTIDYSHEAVRDNGGRLTLRIFDCLKPVIAAVNGPAVGIGFTMTLPMDVRLASQTARFGAPFARRGVAPEAASTWFLPRLVGISRAMEWCISGRLFDAGEALAHGLVRSVLPPEQLLPAARALAHEMTSMSAPVSIALTRQLLWRGLTLSDPFDAHRIESRSVYALGRSPDAREGISAYLEKREVHFPGRVSQDMPDFYPWWPKRQYD
jgi:enoyl-CoA hydratase/carnithine racemase